MACVGSSSCTITAPSAALMTGSRGASASARPRKPSAARGSPKTNAARPACVNVRASPPLRAISAKEIASCCCAVARATAAGSTLSAAGGSATCANVGGVTTIAVQARKMGRQAAARLRGTKVRFMSGRLAQTPAHTPSLHRANSAGRRNKSRLIDWTDGQGSEEWLENCPLPDRYRSPNCRRPATTDSSVQTGLRPARRAGPVALPPPRR